MIWLFLLLLTATQPHPVSRDLAPIAEPIVPPAVEGTVLETVFLPYVIGGFEVSSGEVRRPIYGYASPHQRVYDVPFYNWGQYPRYCDNPNYWPMARGQMNHDISECDDGQRTLLLYNEPELGSFSATQRDAVAFIDSWTWWTGPLACCGNFYADGGGDLTGLQWFLTMITEYHIAHGIVPPIDAIHLHVYEQSELDLETLRMWRDVADAYGWYIIVSESGVSPNLYMPDEIAAKLPVFLTQVEATLRPRVLMWFSDYITDAFGDGTPWHRLNLTNADRSITVVGEAWYEYIAR